MNVWQLLRLVKQRSLDARWAVEDPPTGSPSPVFRKGSVFISAAPDLGDKLQELILPALFIRATTYQNDPEERELPELLQQRFIVSPFVHVAGAQWGEESLMGANRKAKDASDGRGLHELQEQVFKILVRLGADQGVVIKSTGGSGVLQAPVPGFSNYISTIDMEFEADISTKRSYYAPRVFRGTEAGGTVTLTWTAPDDAIDLISYTVRRITGTRAVAEPTLGTDVPVSPPTGLTTTDAPAAGTHTYSIFAGYNEIGTAPLWFSRYEAVTVVVP